MQASFQVYETQHQAVAAAASAVAAELCRLIAEKGRAIGIFDSSISQAEFLDALVGHEAIEWTRVVGFHTAEFMGVDENAPQSQRKVLLDHLVRRVPMAEFHGLRGEAANPEAACANYAALLRSRPPDFAMLNFGEDSSVSLTDPDDVSLVRVIKSGKMGSVLSLTASVFQKCPRLFVIACGSLEIADLPAILTLHTDLHLFTTKNFSAKSEQ